MSQRKTRSFRLVCCVLLLCMAVALIALFQRASEQQRLDHELIAAIARDNPERVAALLEQGASPNTHAGSPIGPWQRMLQLLHRGNRAEPATPTALQIALGDGIIQPAGTIAFAPANHLAHRYHLSIVTMLLRRGAAIDANTRIKQSEIIAARLFSPTRNGVQLVVETRDGMIALLSFIASDRDVEEFKTELAKASRETRLVPFH